MDINEVMDRVKNLQVFEVVMEVPDSFVFRGRIPYDMKIRDNTATMYVPAISQIEAEQRAWDFFRDHRGY